MLVLDASGSMWGQLPDGQSKIEVARTVLGGFFAARDGNVPLGVIAYGHNRKGDCTDIEVIAPTAPQDASALRARLTGLSPKGKTPLGQALRLAAAQIPATAEQADIVLVTDGLETCGVDPCAVAAELATAGIALRAHVVGFGLTASQAQALACIPDQTGGMLLRPQSGAELSEALARTTAPPAPATAGTRLILSWPGAMPDSYGWTLRDEQTGRETVLGQVSGDARYRPFAVDLAPGTYSAIVTARAGRGEARFTVAGQAQDVIVPMQGLLPVTVLRDRGPYAAIGQTVLFDLTITQEGQETGGADLALRLYPAGGGDAITYSTVDGRKGLKNAGLNLPETPGPYLLQLETWGGEVLAGMIIATERDPAVTLAAAPVVEPGAVIAIDSTGSQLSSDRIELWQGETRIGWGLTLGDLQYGNLLHAPDTPGTYDLVYRGYDMQGAQVEKARTRIEVGTLTDDATTTAAMAPPAPQPDDGHGPDDGGPGDNSDGRPWADYPYRCLPGDKADPLCTYRDRATGLSFTLPQGWVADQPSDRPMTAGRAAAGDSAPPSVTFWQAGGNLHQIVLNPHQWIADNGPCVVSRAGPLCLWRSDTAPDDPAATGALARLQHSLTTGAVIRRCGDADCLYDHPRAGIIGRMPALWSVEMPRKLADGRLATWFFDRDRAGNVKLIGLNQDGDGDCADTRAGRLCAFTPYIATQEFDLIRDTLMPRDGISRGVELDQDSFDRVETLLKGQ